MIVIGSFIHSRFYLFLLHLNLCFIGLYFSDIAIKQEQRYISINYCKSEEFQCENGQCIAQPFVCDGIPDCENGSDETYNLCRNITCGEQYFQCDYGACINKEYQCDGRQQCSDGSDERKEECDNTRIKRKFTRTKRASSNLCAVPSISLDRTINYNCQSDCNPSSGYVPNTTIAVVSCKPNFHPEEGVSELSICSGRIWKPPIANCYKRCDKLKPINVNMRCTRKGIIIACDENSLISGSKIRPFCRPLHRYADAVAPDYIEINCNENGKWDRRLFQCVPECGRSYLDIYPAICEDIQVRIKGGVEERYGDSPWHVAIYNSKKILICGGTIIHPYIVLSAAHCFEENDTLSNNTAEYEVVVSKMTRNYTVIDNNCQRVHKIKEIRASPGKEYFGYANFFTADIVALILEEKITISSSVLPACVDWISLSKKAKLVEDTLGKVSGWGLNGTQIDPYTFASEQLKTANLSFISRGRCLRTVPDAFKKYVTFDKFCAGREGGPGVLQGDSGGGFLIPQVSQQKETFYYLRGIVSLKDATVTPIAAFTDLADHYEWILATRDEIDKSTAQRSKKTSEGPSGNNICRSYNVSNCVMVQNCPITDLLILSKKAIYCGYDDNTESEKICCKLPFTGQVLPHRSESKTKAVKPARVRTSAEIASSHCEEYSRYATDCVIDVPPRGRSVPALHKEYPHLALISMFLRHGDTKTWIGSLISDRFVLSHSDAYGASDNPKWIQLGSLSKPLFPSENKESHYKDYDIEKSYIHTNYSLPHYAIALHKTTIKVEFNSYIRPACIYTSNLNLINREMRTFGFGKAGWGNDLFEDIHKSIITVLNDQRCSNYTFDSKSMACAGNVSDGASLCVLEDGSPLQILKENTSCMWTLYAIEVDWIEIPGLGGKCKNFEQTSPANFTKISYHLDWIQSIVWPES